MLREKLANKHVILASGSPRRQQFLRDLDLDFEIRLKEIEEVFPENLNAHEITNYLAELKANALSDELTKNDILITSDTIVWLENKALGKPKNAEDAFVMIQEMSGKAHEVITSVCIKTLERSVTFYESTKVFFLNLTDSEIKYYINLYQPFDKAGSYGIQEWIGLVGIEKIEGSYANVVGLPTHRLYYELMNL
ncbi:Maf-like protein [Flavobacterium sp.]|uniref:Maf-like protein n=1 Tax=Flavobacterium sp. TaxID=239 RepID=UPI0025B8B280|nr:Maf-like protein [Flavobacterium sp.]